MARNFKMTAAKRARERAIVERRQNKATRRAENKREQTTQDSSGRAVDPDLEGIVPGPQPPQDWQIEE